MTYAKIARRSFLHILVNLGALGIIRPTQALATLGTSGARAPLALDLARFFAHRDSAKRVGLEYLRCVPREADERLLVDLICSSRAERRAELDQANKGKLRELLRLQMRQDFEHGRIVNVQGWILSETEGRLCALAALL